MNNISHCGRLRLQEAILNCEYAYYNALPQYEEPILYSARYLKKIRALCRGKDFSLPFFGSNIRKIAAVAMLTAVIFFTGIFSAVDARNTVAQWFTDIRERFTEIFFSGNDIEKAPDSIETPYAPTEIPSGFTEKDRYLVQGEVKFTWENNRGEHIIFIQTPLYSKTTLDNEKTEYETAVISGQKYFLVQKNERMCIYWNTNDYAFTLIVPQTLSEKQWTAIAQSVREFSSD